MSYTMSDISANDIVKIIKQCQGSGVSKFKFNGLEIDFSPQFTSYETSSNIKPKQWLNENTNQSEEQRIFDEEQLELQDLAILDPVEWERLATMDGE